MSAYTTLNRLFGKVSTILNDLKTGYDGTEYQSAGEAVRTQISDLHVLIGDEEGTAIAGSAITYDNTESGLTATNVQDAIDEVCSQIEQPSEEDSSGLTTEIKEALLAVVAHIGAWTDANAQTYYDDLYDALYAVTSLTLDVNSISMTSIGATQLITATVIPDNANITWTSSDTTVATVDNTGLVTSVAYGTATITATAGSMSATCSVVIAQATVTSITAVYTQTGSVYDTDPLSVLTSDLVVTASWSNGTTSTVSSSDYTLSGTLAEGTSTVTVSYGGQSDTFDVTVTARTLLYNWDFTSQTPYVDTVNGTTATANGTVTCDSNGMVFGTNKSYLGLAGLKVSALVGHEVEIVFGDMVSTEYVSGHQRVFVFASQYGFILNKNNQYWSIYGTLDGTATWQSSTLARTDIANKTIKFVFNSVTDIDIYADGELILENASVSGSGNYTLGIGASSSSSVITKIKALRIFD